MEDTLYPILAILIGGLFAPILIQLIEKLFEAISGSKDVPTKPKASDDLKTKTAKWLKFLGLAISIQLLLFTLFFYLTKWTYFDKNYFPTVERELIREGIKRGKEYIIPKITIRVYPEIKKVVIPSESLCNTVSYCCLLSISYDVIALKDFNNAKVFPEYYEAINASNIIKEPGSEIEGDDKNSQKVIATYDIKTSMKRFERKTITTRADFLYESLPEGRKFFNRSIKGNNFDVFYYPNKEDDVIGEVEFQVISRTLKLLHPSELDAMYRDKEGKEVGIIPRLINNREDCVEFNILTASIPRLYNNEEFGVMWKW